MKIENFDVYDIGNSIIASKYPMATDTHQCNCEITKTVLSLAQSGKGEGHDQFLTGIRVAFDLTASNKMWVEMERYRFVEFVSSQSTMHRASKFDLNEQCNEYVTPGTLAEIERLKQAYLDDPQPVRYLQLLYNLPSGFEITARLTTNYRSLKTIYSQRKNHRLPEWRIFCQWIETLPYAKELIIGDMNE